jgi:hypothetical protein
MKRIILSIIAGFFVTALLSTAVDHVFHVTGIYPPYGVPFFDTGLLLLAFSYRAVFAVLGSYVTALLAKDQAMKAVLILGSIGSVIWLAGAIVMWEYASPWYNILGILTGVPLSLMGGKLYQARVQQAK